MTKGQVPPDYALNWVSAGGISSQKYDCGHCGRAIASERGWHALSTYDNKVAAYVCICHYCQRPTFIDQEDVQYPGTVPGNPVADVPVASVASLYDEARKAAGAGCHTASVLACRKLLMHIAVEKGAKVGQRFVTYVEFLAKNNYIPPDAREWVDHIRKKSNEANHEILIMTRGDAEELVSFVEMLLKVIYEFPAAIKRRATNPPSPT